MKIINVKALLSSLFITVLLVSTTPAKAASICKANALINNRISIVNQNPSSSLRNDSVLNTTLGGTCKRAIKLIPDFRFNKQEFKMPDTTIWFEFVADSANIRIFIENNSDTLNMIKSLSVYSGDCNNMKLIAFQNNEFHSYITDISYDTYNLIKGETYFIKVISYYLFTDELNISLQNIKKSVIGSCTEPNSWSQLGNGFNYNVNNLKTIGGSLYAVGEFASSGGNQIDRVSKWDNSNSNWTSLNSGMNNDVRDLCDYNGDLIAGGSFTQAGSLPIEKIAKWNGTDWLPLGVGISGSPVHSLCVYNNELYVGSAGKFNIGGGTIDYSIAKWDGANWSAVGGGIVNNNPLNTRIFAMTVHNNDLYVGGIFQMAGTSTFVNNIAKWDGTDWFPLDMGVNGSVSSICEYNNELYIGGEFTQAGNNTVNYIARWDEQTSTWMALNNGTVTRITSMCVFNNALYVSGFDYNDTPWIAKWDGTTWSDVCTGMNNQHVRSLKVYNNELYAGGDFSEATGNQAQRIAKWCSPQPEAGNNTNLCSGESTLLNASGGESYSWSSTPMDIGLLGQNTSQRPTVAPIQTTTYSLTVSSSFGCISTDDIEVSINPILISFNVTGGGSYCSGSSGMSVILSGSQTGVKYKLLKNGINESVAVSGTGSALLWNNLSDGIYTVVAAFIAPQSCSLSMNDSAVILKNPLPVVFSLSGGGSYCTGSSGTSIKLSGSQAGVNYQLKKSCINIGSMISGTGNFLTWYNLTAGTYSVVAIYNDSPYCAAIMDSFLIITESPNPTILNVTIGAGESGYDIMLYASQIGINYQLLKNGSNVGSFISGTGNNLAWNNLIADTYSVLATYATYPNCSATMNGPFTITDVQSPDSNSENFNVYPNPFSNLVTVSLNNLSTTNAEISTYDILGKLVYQKVIDNANVGITNITLDFSSLSDGVYYIVYMFDGLIRNKKIIKQ